MKNSLALTALLALPVQSAVTITEATQVTLLRGSTTVGTFAGWDACQAEARRLANASTATSGTVTYTCQTERRRVVAAYSANPPPTPPPPPPPPPSEGETVGTVAAMNLQASPVYRVSMAAGSYPFWVTNGATHTNLPTGAWDGSGAARLTPPTGDQSYSAIGGFGNLSRGGTYPLRSLNIRFELRLGPTWVTSNAVGDPKFIIVHTSATANGATNERPMAYIAPSPPCAVYAVAASTTKQYNHSGTSPDWWPSGREAFRFCNGPTAGAQPVVPAGEWVSIEYMVIAEARPGYPNGAIRSVVTRRNGQVLLDYFIPWTYDANWSLPKFITEVQVIGGYFNAGNAANAGNYMDIAGLTFAANRTTVLGPRAGFVQP